MKLSEVIKAIEDGSKSEYLNKQPGCIERLIKLAVDGSEWVVSPKALSSLPLNLWEEVKPPRQWSEKELMLFKLLPDKFDWIAINSVGNVFAYDSKPEKIKVGERSGFNNCLGKYIRLEFDFLTITFEESPIYIGNLKGE